MIAREESFPGTPRRCDPDQYCLSGLLFEPVDAGPGEVRLVATYKNDDAEHFAPQSFELTAWAVERGEAVLREYCRHLRVWFEAVPVTPEMRDALRQFGEEPSEESMPAEPADAETNLAVELSSEVDGPVAIFSLIDPWIGPNEVHGYHRPSPGPARLTVTCGRAQLEHVDGGPYSVLAVNRSPRRAAGAYCRVRGQDNGGCYYVGSVWD
jgi:hypothetical protein